MATGEPTDATDKESSSGQVVLCTGESSRTIVAMALATSHTATNLLIQENGKTTRSKEPVLSSGLVEPNTLEVSAMIRCTETVPSLGNREPSTKAHGVITRKMAKAR